MIQIKLTRGLHAAIDAEDYQLISLHKWRVNASRDGKLYASATINGKLTLMHRYLKGATDRKTQIDHIDNDGLNNRRNNLRVCNHSANNCNKGVIKSNTSGYKGVSWHKRSRKWEAYIAKDSKKTTLGYFTEVKEAAKAYNGAALVFHGEFAKLNAI